MAENRAKWPSKRGPVNIITSSDGFKGDTAPLAMGRGYDYHEFGRHPGNVAKVYFGAAYLFKTAP